MTVLLKSGRFYLCNVHYILVKYVYSVLCMCDA